MSNLGPRGALRLLQTPLSKEASWLLPLALFGALALALSSRPRWPAAPKHQALVLWGGWLVTAGVFFSAAGFFHEYYLTMLAAPASALAAIAIAQLWELRARHAVWSLALLLAVTGVTAWFQVSTGSAFLDRLAWLPEMLALLGLGAALLIAALRWKPGWIPVAGFVCLAMGLLITPGAWSVLTAINTPAFNPLPAAYIGKFTSPVPVGIQVERIPLETLQIQDTYYLLATPSSMTGADYVLATGRPVLYLGGFNGGDAVVSAQDLDALVAQGKLRYVLWSNVSSGTLMQSGIPAWVLSTCRPVQGFDSLYDCGGFAK
jgi:4-amino-4-deoxy-L-arabinose transferase-like glycosyltransferase